ncbi:MAG: hypothetical protein R6W94_03835 [Spirochaetia bacterium]
MLTLPEGLRYWLSDINNFGRLVLKRPLRRYQLRPAEAVLRSVLEHQGPTFAVMMSRQPGKNELSAQLEAYLLNLYRLRGGQIVKGSPTFKPQTVNSILRLTDRLSNFWNQDQFRRREGYIIELDHARAFFFSAEPSANVVGATASLLLEGDEVQGGVIRGVIRGAARRGKLLGQLEAVAPLNAVGGGPAPAAYTDFSLADQGIDAAERNLREEAAQYAIESPAFVVLAEGEGCPWCVHSPSLSREARA